MFLSINWNPSQSLIKIGSFELRFYSLLFMLAFFVAGLILRYFFKKEKKPLRKLESLMTYVIVGTLLGARLGHVIFYDWDYFKNHLLEILLPFQFEPSFKFTGFAGLASHGAVIGIFIAVLLFVKKNKEFSIHWLLDRGVVATIIAGAFIRIGNFMNSEIVGKIVDCKYPLAVRFLKNNDLTPQEVIQKTGINNYGNALKILTSDAKYAEFLNSIPCRHPTQLYESLTYVIIFFILWLIYHKTNKKDKPYFMSGIFFILIWTARFMAEFVKQSQGGWAESSFGIFSTGQWLSIPLIFLGFYLVFKKTRT